MNLISPNSSFSIYKTKEKVNELKQEFQSKFEVVEFTNFDKDEFIVYVYQLKTFIERKEYDKALYICKQMITGLTFGSNMEYFYVNSYIIIIICLFQVNTLLSNLCIYHYDNYIEEALRWISIIDEEFDETIYRNYYNFKKRKSDTIFDDEFLQDIKRIKIEFNI